MESFPAWIGLLNNNPQLGFEERSWESNTEHIFHLVLHAKRTKESIAKIIRTYNLYILRNIMSWILFINCKLKKKNNELLLCAL